MTREEDLSLMLASINSALKDCPADLPQRTRLMTAWVIGAINAHMKENPQDIGNPYAQKFAIDRPAAQAAFRLLGFEGTDLTINIVPPPINVTLPPTTIDLSDVVCLKASIPEGTVLQLKDRVR